VKKCLFLFAVLVLTALLVSCSGDGTVSTSPETEQPPVSTTVSPITTNQMPVTTTRTADTTKTPAETQARLTYSYALSDIGASAVQAEQIEGSLIYFNPYVPEENENLFSTQGSFSGVPDITLFNFFGEERTVQPFSSVVAFPKHPKEYGTLSKMITPSEKGKSAATIMVRQNTGKVVRIYGKFENLFQDIDLYDESEFVPYFTQLLSQYASFEAYTLFVYEAVTTGSKREGICVEYNKTIDGQKTNCLVKMIVTYEDAWCEVVLQDDMEEVFAPYQNVSVSYESIDAIVREEMAKACETSSYRYNGYRSTVTLMVLDGKLKAFVEAVADMTTMDTGEEVYVPPVSMLITVASFE